ncbi:MAG: ketoacyl-ACP synthase III [Chloroflexi bacterium]|nr:ketoacyl-ACP synthase III [Chloroflexota bacterium]
MEERYGNIVGWGKYTPERVVTNAELEEKVDTSHEWIVERTGIHQRHIVSEGEHTSYMATEAGRAALKKANIRARDLDLIIVATSSPDYLTPPISSQVQQALGAKDVGAFTLVTGCTGFVYSLATAQQFIAAGTADKILVIGAELISRWLDWEDRETCVLFGDGAGAVVMEASNQPAGVLAYTLGSDGSKAEHLILPGGGSRNPPSTEMIEQGLHKLQMNGREVFKFATRIMGKSLKKTIKKAGLTVEDIDLFIPHQANKRIIDSAARQVGLPKEKVFVNIQNYGNTSAASIPIALCEALEQDKAKIGDTLAFVAFGAGLTWATAVVKLTEREQPEKKSIWQLPILKWFSRNGFRRVAKKEAPEPEAVEEV